MKNTYNDILSNKEEFDSLLKKALYDVGKEDDNRLASELSNMDEKSLRAMLSKDDDEVAVVAIIETPNWFQRNYKLFGGLVAACVLFCILIPMNLSDGTTTLKGGSKTNATEKPGGETIPADTVQQHQNVDTLIKQ